MNTPRQNNNMENESRQTSSRTFHVIAVTITVFLMITLVWINVYHRGSRHFQDGERFLKEDKLIQAVTSFESSAHAYTPFNSNVRISLDRLWEIGEALEQKHSDPTYPLVAYRSLRSSIYAVRSFYMPYKEWIPKCDEKISYLVSIQKEQIEAARKNSQQPLN